MAQQPADLLYTHTAVEQGVHEALGTLTLRHELAWA
jgi:hypothetical protein